MAAMAETLWQLLSDEAPSLLDELAAAVADGWPIDTPVDEDQMTLLHHACARGNAPLASALLAAGASVSARDAEGNEALAFAAMAGDAPIAEALLARRAAVDARNALGESAMIIAAAHGQCEAIRVLLQAGADLALKPTEGLHRGRTALVVARACMRIPAARLLESNDSTLRKRREEQEERRLAAAAARKEAEAQAAEAAEAERRRADEERQRKVAAARRAVDEMERVREGEAERELERLGAEAPAAPHAQCAEFRLNLRAASAAECVCGLPKAAHSAAALQRRPARKVGAPPAAGSAHAAGVGKGEAEESEGGGGAAGAARADAAAASGEARLANQLEAGEGESRMGAAVEEVVKEGHAAPAEERAHSATAASELVAAGVEHLASEVKAAEEAAMEAGGALAPMAEESDPPLALESAAKADAKGPAPLRDEELAAATIVTDVALVVAKQVVERLIATAAGTDVAV
ncbi:hypothetical protein AB1Y20_004547 [Prymnesium parvum]|uniref:Uncharacterized protein n=1 Tax=Prymnesium parvum TaxID=97485 RepID=A0AB34IZJ0_PRYPA